MKLWKEGSIRDLVREGRAIRSRMPKSHLHGGEQQLARSFAKFKFQGKTNAALQLLADKSKGDVLRLHDTVHNGVSEPMTMKKVLKSKHPPVGL